MDDAHAAYLSRLRAQITNTRDMGQVPRWLMQHTRAPNDPDLPFSFKGHEYQIEMISDPAPVSAIKKCSQVGATEIWFRTVLAVMAIFKSINLIYVLPTIGFVRKVSKGRIDPVIQNSPTLRTMLNEKVNSSDLKQILNSFLYMSGSYSKSAAISVPAQAVFKDEVDFCDQAILSTFASRMGHVKASEKIDRSFSTPTVFDYGIDLLFKQGSQAYYCVRCPSCHDWSKLNYLSKVEIPGYEGNLETFERDDLLNPNYRIQEAFMRCSCCNNPLPYSAFLDPDNRRWIHTYPDRAKDFSSRQIYPLDVPEVNPIAQTIIQIGDYRRKKDWANFKLGEAYQDSETSFVESLIRTHSFSLPIQRPTEIPNQQFSTAFFGLDVGKICHLVVGVPNAAAKDGFDIIYAERIRQTGANAVLERLKVLNKTFHFRCGVVDSAPDITLADSVITWQSGTFWASQYVERMGNTLDIIRLVEEEGICKVLRNSCLDETCKRVNSGGIKLNRAIADYEIVIAHLKAMKKVTQVKEDSDELSGDEVWISNGEDHYGHAINYLYAARLIAGSPHKEGVIPFIYGVAKAKVKDHQDEAPKPADMMDLWHRPRIV